MDPQRHAWIADALRRDGYDALISRLPQSLVLLTGYQPILGNSFCVLTLNAAGAPPIRLALPGDERDLIHDGPAMDVRPYFEETLERTSTTIPAVREPLAASLQ